MRARQRMTQRDLAEKLGVTQNYIPALEAGTRNASPKLRQALMRFFSCSFEDLFDVVMIDPETQAIRLLKPADEVRQTATG